MRWSEEHEVVKIRVLTGVLVLLKIPTRVAVQEVRRVLLHYAETFYLTNYKLVTEDGVELKESLPLSLQLPQRDAVPPGKKRDRCLHLHMVPTPYTYRTVRDHVVRLRDIHASDPHTDLQFTYAYTEALEGGPREQQRVKGDASSSSGLAKNVYPLLSSPSIINMHVSGPNPYCLDSEDDQPYLYPTGPVQAKEVVRLCKNPFTTSHAAHHVAVAALKQPAIGLSSRDPLAQRRLRGDICYFSISLGKQTWGVGACAAGFYLLEKEDLSSHVRASDIYPTLVCLMCAVIPDQRQRYEALVNMVADTRPGTCMYEGLLQSIPPAASGYGLGSLGPHGMAHWLTEAPAPYVRDLWRTSEHEYFVNQPQDARTPQRNWVHPFLPTIDCDPQGMPQHPMPAALYEQIYPEFLSTAMQATVLAVDGTLAPTDSTLPFEERTYVFNGISVSFCCPGDKRRHAAPGWSHVHKEVSLITMLSPDVFCLGRTEVCFTPSCCVDYHGYRAWCEAFSYELYDKFGVPKGVMREAPADAPLPHAEGAAKISEELRKSEHMAATLFPKMLQLEGGNGEWALPEGVHVYKARDDRYYVDGISYAAPPGYRLELLALMHEEREDAASSSSAQSGAGGGGSPNHHAPAPAAAAAAAAADSASSGGSSFGTNELQSRPSVCSSAAAAAPAARQQLDDSEVKEEDVQLDCGDTSSSRSTPTARLSLDALCEQQQRKLYDELAGGVLCPADGADLSRHMHDKGISLRSIGRLLAMNDAGGSAQLPPCVVRLLHLECVARSVKYYVRALLRTYRAEGVAQPLADHLNKLYSHPTSKQAQQVAERVSSHFGVDPTAYTWHGKHDDEWYVIRSVAVKTGIRLISRDFAFSKESPFRKGDFVDMVVVPFGSAEGTNVSQAQARLDEGDVRGGLRDLKLKLSDIAESSGWDAAALNPILFSMGKVALQEGEALAAASLFSRAALSARVSMGEMSPDYQCAVVNMGVAAAPSLQLLSATAVADLCTSLSAVAGSATQYAAPAKTLLKNLRPAPVAAK